MRRGLGIAVLSLWGLCADKLYKLFFGDDANLKGSSFGQFGACLFPCEDEIGFWADGTDDRSAMGLDLADKLFAGLAEGAGDDKLFSCENPSAQKKPTPSPSFSKKSVGAVPLVLKAAPLNWKMPPSPSKPLRPAQPSTPLFACGSNSWKPTSLKPANFSISSRTN